MPTRVDPRAAALVTIGGAVGSLARHGIGRAVDPVDGFPLATFVVNISGSFALGALLTWLLVRGGPPAGRSSLRLVLGTGFLGGYTTYSALAVETDALLRDDRVALALTYAICTMALGLVAAGLGVAVGRRLAG